MAQRGQGTYPGHIDGVRAGNKKDHRAGAFMHCWPVPTTQDAVWVRRPLEKSWQCGRGVSGPGGPCSGGLSLGTGVALKEQRAGWFRWHQGHRFALRAWWGGGGRGGGPSITMMSDRLFFPASEMARFSHFCYYIFIGRTDAEAETPVL